MPEHAKAIPAGDKIALEMDRAAFDLFKRVVDRSEPRGSDNPAAHKAAKDRVQGWFIAAGAQMGWR